VPSRPHLRRRATRAALLGVALLVLGVAAAVAHAELGAPTERSRVVYPVQSLPLSFSHAQHLPPAGAGAGGGVGGDATCVPCHATALSSTSSADVLLPGEAECATCHVIDRARPDVPAVVGKPDGRCESCHPGWVRPTAEAPLPPAVRIPPPNLRFNHRLHAAQRIPCARCHGDLAAEGVGLATRAQLPRMATCLECHDGRKVSARCTSCHPSTADGRVRTSFPEGQLVPSGTLGADAHDLTFVTGHARVATLNPRSCDSCHRKDFCLDCHDGVVKPLSIHGNDYLTLHTVDARRNQPDCQSCHRLQTFCVGCHARSGVIDDPRTSAFPRASSLPGAAQGAEPRRGAFHPAGFAGSGHAVAAERNVRTCVGCHREEFCNDCHGPRAPQILGPGMPAVSPHPVGWATSARCAALQARAKRMCLRCHAQDPYDTWRCE
jgi:hypothetical protein